MGAHLSSSQSNETGRIKLDREIVDQIVNNKESIVQLKKDRNKTLEIMSTSQFHFGNFQSQMSKFLVLYSAYVTQTNQKFIEYDNRIKALEQKLESKDS